MPLAKSSPNHHGRSEITQNHKQNLYCYASQQKKRSLQFLSNTRILLQIHLSRRIRIPSSANIHKSICIRHTNRNIRLALHKLHC